MLWRLSCRLFVAIPVLALAFSATAQGEEARSWFEISVNHGSSYTIKDAGVAPGQTGLASFLNALRFGPKEFHHALDAVPGNRADRLRKMQDLLLNSDPDHEGAPDDLPFGAFTKWCDGLVARDLIVHQPLTPTPNESGEAFLKRIHGYLGNSTENGVPVVLAFDTFAIGTGSAGAVIWEWTRRRYAMVRAVPKKPHESSSGFAIDLLDPLSAAKEPTPAWIALRQFDRSPNEPDEGFLRRTRATLTPEGKALDLSQPFLTLHASTLDEFEHPSWAQRRIVILTWASGQL